MAHAVAVAPAGGILVGGEVELDGYSSCWIAKYSAQGSQLWSRVFAPFPGFDGRVVAIEATAAGGAFVACACNDSSNVRTVAVLRLLADGTIADTVRYSHPSHVYDSPIDLQLTAEDNCLVACRSKSSAANDDCALLSLDSAGTLTWVARYDFLGFPNNVSALAIDSVGNSYLAGMAVYLWRTVASIVKFDPSGDTVWTRTFEGYQETAEFLNVEVGCDGVYAVGYLSFGTPRILTVKYTWDGDTIWSRERVTGVPRATAVLDTVGIVHCSVDDDSTTRDDIKTMLYRIDGTKDWTRRFDGTAHADDAPTDIAVGPNGRVCVSGYVWQSDTRLDCATLCYEVNGDQLWSATYAGDGGEDTDIGSALAVDTLGNVAVAGYTTSASSGKDILVIKYPPSGPAIAETPGPERAEPPQPTLLTRARLLTELQIDPTLSLFDASGRRILNPKSGVCFIRRNAAGGRRQAVTKALITN
ncbi:MAG: hypothetical protein JSU73_05065 [candidate division WOR-3 bacterium]|nr:MAG: hypothetical protein JSU73_05065 [candidate division WOR-3 bacterium]